MADNGPIESISFELSTKNNDEQNINLDLNGSSKDLTKNNHTSPDVEGGASLDSIQRGDGKITDKHNELSSSGANEGPEESVKNSQQKRDITDNHELIEEQNRSESQNIISKEIEFDNIGRIDNSDDVKQKDEANQDVYLDDSKEEGSVSTENNFKAEIAENKSSQLHGYSNEKHTRSVKNTNETNNDEQGRTHTETQGGPPEKQQINSESGKEDKNNHTSTEVSGSTTKQPVLDEQVATEGSKVEVERQVVKDTAGEEEADYSETFEESEVEKTSEISFTSYNPDQIENAEEQDNPVVSRLSTLSEEEEIPRELTSTPRKEDNSQQEILQKENEANNLPGKDEASQKSDATLTAGSWPSYEEKNNSNLREQHDVKTPDKAKTEKKLLKEDGTTENRLVEKEKTGQNDSPRVNEKSFDYSNEQNREDKLEPDEIKHTTQSDDTLDDIEPISSSEQNQSHSAEQTMEQEMEKSDGLKSDLDTSEVADDNARADEHPKRDHANDTDHETEDLRSEEVEKSNSENSNKSNVSKQLQSQKSNSLDSQHVIRSSQSSRIKSPVGSQSSLKSTSLNNQPPANENNVNAELNSTDDSNETSGNRYNEPTKKEDEQIKEIDKQGKEIFDYPGEDKPEKVEEKEEDTEIMKEEDKIATEPGRILSPEPERIQTTEPERILSPEPERIQTAEPERIPTLEPERTPTPEPDPIKITRNITVDHAVDTITELESSVRNLLEDMKELTDGYHIRLKAEPLSSFVQDLDKFRGDFISMQDAYKKCESLFMFLNKSLKELRVTGDELNTTIDRKLREEDLDTWMEVDDSVEEEKSKVREQKIAATKSAIAKANDAKTFVAKAAVAVTEASVFAAECEAEAAEAFGVAARAWEAAQIALKDAEAAQKAAEEKRLAAEEARKRAEERAKKKAEEEKKRQAQEDALLAKEAKRKGVSFEDEKSRAMAEKARKEAERRNPKNWPRNIYSIDPGDFDPGVGCVIRAIDGCLPRDDVEVKRLDQLSGVLTLVENEELVSNIIDITPRDTEKRYIFEEPFAIAIPHCAGRGVPGREPVIKTLMQNGKWVEIPTRDVIFEDIRELRFVEAQTRKFGLFAVVLRLKRDTLTFTRKGNKVSSSVDGRVTFTCPAGMFKSNTNFNVEVQPIDTLVIADLKIRRPTECEKLLASSPIVRFNIPNRKFSKSLTMTVPLPPNPSRSKRPTTASAPTPRDKEDMKEKRALSAQDRPLVSFNANKEDEVEEDIHLLVKDAYGSWYKLPDVILVQAKNKDIVTFDIQEPHDRFLVMRTTINATVPRIEAIAGLLEMSLLHRTVNFFLRQQNNDPNDILVSCSNSSKTDKELRKLAADGYEEGPAPSRDIILREGQIIEIRFRGNVNCVSDNVTHLKMIYNTHIRSKLDFKVEEVDRFAQKSFDFYRGFAQIFTKEMVQKPLTATEKAKAPTKLAEIEEEEHLLAELLINLPKPEPEPPRPLKTAPIRINAEGPDSEDILQYIAGELGDEWKRLAQYLNLRSVRIQAILRQNNSNPDPKKIRYDMLMTWAKRVPRCVNKLEILSHALLACGRGDLAEELRERDLEFRRRRSANLRDTYLQRAFVKVAQNPTAVKDWRLIAKRLGVTEIELSKIEKTKPSIQEKCYHSLRTWQHNAGEEATLPALSNYLRKCNYRGLARDIDAIG